MYTWPMYAVVYPYIHIRIHTCIYMANVCCCVSLYAYKDTHMHMHGQCMLLCILICILGYTHVYRWPMHAVVYPYMHIRIHTCIYMANICCCVFLYTYKDTHIYIHGQCMLLCILICI